MAMTSAGSVPAVGPALTLDDVKRLVESVSPAIQLGYEEKAASGHPRGRYLVARRKIKTGELFLSECPLFCGGAKGERSRKAYRPSFVALMKDSEEDPSDFEEDCLHPLSPLVDCLAGVLLAKRNALHSRDKQEREEAKKKILQLGCLFQTNSEEAVQEEIARDLYGELQPELQQVTSEREIYGFLCAMVGNRFGGADSKMDVMFAGSMFEHSCTPNCFVATWRGTPPHRPRRYRALRDIEEGEALSVDYLHLPDVYMPASVRAEHLARWNFACSCPRCTTQPEISRCFICEACGVDELCPATPGSDSVLECRACGATANEKYTERCQACEAEVLDTGHSQSAAQLLGPMHFTFFMSAWSCLAEGPWPSDGLQTNLAATLPAVRSIVDAISRLYANPRHPHLLDFYHLLAEFARSDLEEQHRFLQFERSVLQCYYLEEAETLDAEIMHLITGKGPFQPGAASEGMPQDFSDVDFGTFVPAGLDCMD